MMVAYILVSTVLAARDTIFKEQLVESEKKDSDVLYWFSKV